MKDSRQRNLEQRAQAVLTLMSMALVILLIQLWLITIAIEDFLAARTVLAIPTFVASGFCLAVNLWVLKMLYGVDGRGRDRES